MKSSLIKIFNINGNKELISFVGAGGKTTTMFSIAQELKNNRKKVLISTTTAIYNPKGNYDYYFLKEINDEFSPQNGSITILGETVVEGKLRGISSDKIDKINETNIFDFILVEADGAKKKSIKAPRELEPIVPNTTTKTIGVIGLDSVGKIINDENVHRVDLFIEITGKEINHKIDEEDIIKLVLHHNGLFKDSKGEKILLLNKCDRHKIDTAYNIRKKLLDKGFKNIVIANIKTKEFF